MLTATTIIPRPPVISKYFNISIVVLQCDLTLLPRFHLHRLPSEEQAEHLTENQLHRQECNCQRENHSRDDCHCCDCHLHYELLEAWHWIQEQDTGQAHNIKTNNSPALSRVRSVLQRR